MGGDRAGPSAIGKQPAPVAMVLRRPHLAQALVDRLGHCGCHPECVRPRHGKASAAGASAWGVGSFFKKCPVLAKGVPVKELDAVMAGFEGSPRVPLAYREQVTADFLLGQLVGRSVSIMLYQCSDSLQI